jgi:hypothetical protein
MTKGRFKAWWLFLGAAPVLLWMPVGFVLQALGLIGESALYTSIILLAGLAVVSCLAGSVVLIIRAFLASRHDPELARVGRAAVGVVRELDEIGGAMTVNDNPVLKVVLEVHDGDRPPYEVELETLIPRYAVPAVQPGRNVPLLVHPANPRRIEINWGAEEVPTPLYGVRHDAATERLLSEEGLRGMATILTLEDSGRTRGLEVVVDLRLKVYLPDEEPYEAEVEMPLPEHMIAHLRGLVERSVECLVHPEEREMIKLLLERD